MPLQLNRHTASADSAVHDSSDIILYKENLISADEMPNIRIL